MTIPSGWMTADEARTSITPEAERKFYALFRVTGQAECWEWSGPKYRDGYGKLSVCGREYKAHRVAYTLLRGAIPDGMLVRHQCDVRACCNPAHLAVGTDKDNSDDKHARGRANALRGEQHSRVKITEADVRSIRATCKTWADCVVAAKRIGISKVHAFRIMRGATWSWLTTPPTPEAVETVAGVVS